MGLIRAAVGAVGGVMADQWKDYFYCEAMDKDILVKKGRKRTGKRSSNTRGEDNIITNGSVIAVADGQCMLIVDQGRVAELCAQPGEFIYDVSTEPSIFTGDLKEGIAQTFENIGKRFSFGGDAPKDQRVYYINTKELVDNKFGTASPIPFRVVDRNIGLDIDVSVRCNGIYSYRIADPVLFYTNVCGNVESEYTRAEIDSQLKAEFLTALQPAFARISELQIRPSAIPGHVQELSEAMNEALTKKWSQLRGLEIVSVGVNQVTLPPEDAEMIKQAQRTAIMRDPTMAAATLTGAQADAMKMAASNDNGAMMGFMGMNMASQAGGMNAQTLFQMGAEQQARNQEMQRQQMMNASQQNSSAGQSVQSSSKWICSCGTKNNGKFCMNCGNPKPVPKPADEWICSCGAKNSGKFCMNCGAPRPAAPEGWTCSCGALNKGKFCMECGRPKPAGVPQYKCDKCGWEPEDKQHPPKFCPQCGDPFDDGDII